MRIRAQATQPLCLGSDWPPCRGLEQREDPEGGHGYRRRLGLPSGSNGPKILKAPVTVIVGYDLDFPRPWTACSPTPRAPSTWFGDPVAKEVGALRNSSLQGGYFILAARALGLDVGPMSGFDNAGVDAAFFAGTNIKSNFIASIGYGTEEGLFPRNPRLDFEEAAQIV